MNEQQKSAFSSRFPGLDEGQISRLVEVVDNMGYTDPIQKLEKQRQLYQQVLPMIQEKKHKEGRIEMQNQLFSKRENATSTQDFVNHDIVLKTSEFADLFRKSYGVPSKVSDDEVIKALTNGDPDFKNKFTRYLNGDMSVLREMGMQSEDDTQELEQEQGGFKGILARAGGDWGLGEWLNPIGRATEYLDDLIQKIPTVNFEGREEELRKRIDAVGEEERQAFEEKFNSNRTLQALYGNVDNYIKESKKSFMDQFLGIGDEGPNVVKQFLNVPGSFLKTASGISRAMTNPLDTVVGLKNLLTTEEGRQLVIDRYGTNFQQTLEEDPIGLASDVLSVVGMGGGALAKGAKLAGLESTASKIGKFASVADNVGNLGLDVVKAKGMGMLGEIGGGGNALTKAGVKYVQLTQAPLQTAGEMTKGIIKALPSAEHTLQNMNRLTKGEQSKFKSMVGESQGEWMNNRGIVAGGESAVDQLAEYFVNSKKKVDEALQTIGGEYKNPYLDMMAKEASEFAENTLSKEAGRIKELAQKAETQGLTMSEINEVKRFYEKNNKFTYGKDITAGEKSVRATNIDNNVREWQMDIAEENGFGNLRELNKETQASKFLLDKLVKNNDGSFGNNFFTLTDYITAVGLGDITALPGIFTKKMMSSDWFRTNYAKIINKINGHQTIAEKIADIEAIKKIQSKKALENFLKDGYNTKNQNLNSNSNQDAIDLHVHSRGASLDDGQSIQKQTAQIEGSLGEINEGASGRVGLKGNIERSDGKKALTEESIIEKYRQKAIKELGLPEGTTEINLAELMGDKKKYAKYQEITAEMQKELGYLGEDGYYTKKWHDDLESRKRKAYGEQKHSLRDDEGLNKLREGADLGNPTKAPAGAKTAKYQLAEPIKSENFKKWFGDWENDPKNASKVVNEKGEPLLMYHGSPEKFTIFDSDFMSQHGSSKGYGFYFSPDKKMAEGYGDAMTVYLDIKNPLSKDKLSISRKEMKNLILDVEKNIAKRWGTDAGTLLDNFGDTKRYGKDRVLADAIDMLMENESDVDVFGELKNIGGDYDSVAKSFRKVLKKDGIITPKEYIVFESNQIKSATDNIGAFDANNPDIRYQKHGVANPLEKEISAEKAIQLRNIRNGRSVQELADHYGLDTKIVEKITTPEGLQAYGKYGDGIITLAEKIKEGTAPHELFHATFDIVDHARKETILEGVMKEKKVDKVQAEEYLADSFSEYFRTGRMKGEKVIGNVGKPLGKKLYDAVKDFFKQVKDWITGVSKTKKQVKQLFDEILDGEVDRGMIKDFFNQKNTSPLFHAKGVGEVYKRSVKISPENANIIAQNLSELKNNTDGLTYKNFVPKLQEALTTKGDSTYITNKIDGVKYTLRVSNHNANAYHSLGHPKNNTSVVVKILELDFKHNKNVDLVEFVYDKNELTPQKMSGIVNGVQDWMDTGKYTDKGYNEVNTSIRATLENGEVKYQIAYHGSPYEFDAFDSSHMGKGEGAQAHGWGHYVAVDKNTANRYAQMGDGMIGYKGEKIPTYDPLMTYHEKALWTTKRGLDSTTTFGDAKKFAIDKLQGEVEDYSKRLKAIETGKPLYSNDAYQIDELKNALKDSQQALKEVEKIEEKDFNRFNKNLYKVDIPDPVKAKTPTGKNYIKEGYKITEKQFEKIKEHLKDVIPKQKRGYWENLNVYKWGESYLGNRTWGNLYKDLLSELGSPKEVSMFFKGMGYDGISYHGGIDGEAYVIFDDNKLKILDHKKL